MANVIVVGGGIAGLCGSMLLARDGHQVRLLERDPESPTTPEEAWDSWRRRGVNQFNMLHYFLPRFRETVEAELPELATALEVNGALRLNFVSAAPDEITGGPRPGDERFTVLTGRRPVVEAVIAGLAAAEPNVEVMRGVAVRGLLADGSSGVPHVCRGRHRRRRRAAGGSRGGRKRSPVAAAGLAGGARCPRSLRGARRLWLRLLRAPLPLVRRLGAGRVRSPAAALRVDLAAAAAGGQRDVGRRRRRQRGRRADARRPSPRRLDAHRVELSAGGALARR